MKKPELLAPAGDFEKLKYAIHYGADAVYLSGQKFGLRAYAGNFSLDEIKNAVQYAHLRNVKIYITVNMYPHNDDLIGLAEYLHILEDIGVDALIVADLGVYHLTQCEGIKIPIHISTQATTVNWYNVLYWKDQPNVERVVLARELTVDEIKTINNNVSGIELENFVHGAMCMSYSGRCLISNYLAGRDANRGECAQPCRWKYALVEETRPNEYFPIEEDEHGSYIFNSHDLCLIENLDKVIESGIYSLKIEGRMKSIYYVSTVVRAYRNVLDQIINPKNDFDLSYWKNELEKISHRPYTTGFYFNCLETAEISNTTGGYIKPYDFCAVVIDYDQDNDLVILEERNKIIVGDTLEFIGKDYREYRYEVKNIYDINNQEINAVAEAKKLFKLKIPFKVNPMDIVRKPYI